MSDEVRGMLTGPGRVCGCARQYLGLQKRDEHPPTGLAVIDFLVAEQQGTNNDQLIRDAARSIVEVVSLAYQSDKSSAYIDDLLSTLNKLADQLLATPERGAK